MARGQQPRADTGRLRDRPVGERSAIGIIHDAVDRSTTTKRPRDAGPRPSDTPPPRRPRRACLGPTGSRRARRARSRADRPGTGLLGAAIRPAGSAPERAEVVDDPHPEQRLAPASSNRRIGRATAEAAPDSFSLRRAFSVAAGSSPSSRSTSRPRPRSTSATTRSAGSRPRRGLAVLASMLATRSGPSLSVPLIEEVRSGRSGARSSPGTTDRRWIGSTGRGPGDSVVGPTDPSWLTRRRW